MVEIFGSVKESKTVDDRQFTTFTIPAFSKRAARQRANINARIKGLANPEVDSATRVGNTNVPAQKIYEVTIISDL